MKKTLEKTKVTVILKKSECSDSWRLVLFIYPVYENGQPMRKFESLNRTVTTPVWVISKNGIRPKPKRDNNGVIQCMSECDKIACQYAESVRSLRQQEYDRLGLFSDVEKEMLMRQERGNCDFIEYYKSVIRKNHPGSNANVLEAWDRVVEILLQYSKGKPIPFKTINVGWLTDMKYYMLDLDYSGGKKKGKISQNTASHYFSVLKAGLKMAYIDDFLPSNIAEKVPGIKVNDGRREALTIEEVQRLINTPCEYEVIRRASIFSILTGMRHCDIKALTWSKLVNIGGIWRVDFTQLKTKGVEYMPISHDAYEICGDRKEQERAVFEGLPDPSWISKPLKKWVESAGITKHITFHCFRHTFATLQLTMGTDIYTVSKMLGHTKVTTTQIYTKIVDSKKIEAANAIKVNLDSKNKKTIKQPRIKILIAIE